jgi:multicomponent Na+:H+ antiporter subunit B
VSRRARTRLFGAAALVVGSGLVWAFAGLPRSGHYNGVYGLSMQHVALAQRHATDLVSSVTFDYRGFDTLGEEFILFVSATGCAVLLRAQRDEHSVEQASERAEARAEEVSRPLRALGAGLVAPVLVLGGYVVAHGHLSPGGGFQGGVILAAAMALVFIAGQLLALNRARPMALVELGEAIGGTGYALIAIGGLIFGVAALHNFLPLGKPGDLLSGGMIPLLNVAVGLEVAGAFTLVVSEFLDQALLRRARS